MAWKNANSSMIAEYEYDPDMGVMHLRFQSGRIASYPDFPPELAAEFEAAPSKGKFFHANIRDQYAAR